MMSTSDSINKTLKNMLNDFYRAALNAGRFSYEKGVCLSVCQTRGL